MVTFQCSIKKEYPRLSVQTVTILFPFLITCILWKARFSAYASAKTTDSHRLQTEADRRFQLPSVKPDITDILKNVKQFLSFQLSLFWKNVVILKFSKCHYVKCRFITVFKYFNFFSILTSSMINIDRYNHIYNHRKSFLWSSMIFQSIKMSWDQNV